MTFFKSPKIAWQILQTSPFQEENDQGRFFLSKTDENVQVFKSEYG